MSWDEAEEELLRADPRFEAGVALRASQDYEEALEFFSELLKTFDLESKPPLHLAHLYYQLGSTLVCSLEAAMGPEVPASNSSSSGDGGSSSSSSSSSTGDSSDAAVAEGPPLKKNKTGGDECDGDGDNDGGSDVDQEEEESEDDEEKDDEDIAWQYLDTARTFFREALDGGGAAGRSAPQAKLAERLTRDLARTVSRLGDLNFLAKKWGDSLVEYEQVISLREGLREDSVVGVCRLVDTYIQVALTYNLHLSENGEVDVTVDTTDSGICIVAAGSQCREQILAYREHAKTAMSNLITRLSRDRVELSVENKEEICVQFELLEDLDNRITSLRIGV